MISQLDDKFKKENVFINCSNKNLVEIVHNYPLNILVLLIHFFLYLSGFVGKMKVSKYAKIVNSKLMQF